MLQDETVSIFSNSKRTALQNNKKKTQLNSNFMTRQLVQTGEGKGLSSFSFHSCEYFTLNILVINGFP